MTMDEAITLANKLIADHEAKRITFGQCVERLVLLRGAIAMQADLEQGQLAQLMPRRK